MYPVIGILMPDPVSEALETKYMRFATAEVHGLAKVPNAGRLDLLAIHSMEPGTGQLRRFVEACQREYRLIIVWSILNNDLPAILAKFGFSSAREFDVVDGEQIVMRWERSDDVV